MALLDDDIYKAEHAPRSQQLVHIRDTLRLYSALSPLLVRGVRGEGHSKQYG
jgi:hypothetical protein